MGFYRKKPVVIEAVLFDGDFVGEPLGQGGRAMPRTTPLWLPATVCTVTVEPTASTLREGDVVSFAGALWIGTLEGAHRVSAGDMIIRGIGGELYPCKPDIFAATYEAAT